MKKLALLVAVGALALGGCGEEAALTSEDKQKPKVSEAEPIDIKTIASAIHNNPAIFEQDYKGTARQFSLPIEYIGGTLSGGSFHVGLAIPGRNEDVHMYFDHLTDEEKRKFIKGQMITANCIVHSGDLLSIHLFDCALVSG